MDVGGGGRAPGANEGRGAGGARRRVRAALFGLLLVFAAVASACTSNSWPPVRPYGGVIEFWASVDPNFAFEYVSFLDSAGDLYFTPDWFESCARFDQATPAPTPSADPTTSLDAGTNLAATLAGSSSQSFEIPRYGTWGNYDYENTVPLQENATYSLSLPGGLDIGPTELPGAIAVPDFPTLSQADENLPASGAITIQWTPGGGDEAVIDFYPDNYSPATVECYVRDDGSFTVPSDIAEGVTPAGLVGIFSVRRNYVDISERSVVIYGVAQGYGEFYQRAPAP